MFEAAEDAHGLPPAAERGAGRTCRPPLGTAESATTSVAREPEDKARRTAKVKHNGKDGDGVVREEMVAQNVLKSIKTRSQISDPRRGFKQQIHIQSNRSNPKETIFGQEKAQPSPRTCGGHVPRALWTPETAGSTKPYTYCWFFSPKHANL